MATDKQIAANRANCKRSTGPKTPAGQLKSSRNAFRHGLSLPLSADPQTQANIEALAGAVAGDTVTSAQLGAARQFAAAHLELTRIRNACAQVTSKLSTQAIDPHSVRRLLGFDRYEQRGLNQSKHPPPELDHLLQQRR